LSLLAVKVLHVAALAGAACAPADSGGVSGWGGRLHEVGTPLLCDEPPSASSLALPHAPEAGGAGGLGVVVVV